MLERGVKTVEKLCIGRAQMVGLCTAREQVLSNISRAIKFLHIFVPAYAHFPARFPQSDDRAFSLVGGIFYTFSPEPTALSINLYKDY